MINSFDTVKPPITTTAQPQPKLPLSFADALNQVSSALPTTPALTPVTTQPQLSYAALPITFG